jgi:hypothetical protein
MSLYNTVNVKNLPELEEVVNGNYLIIENENGTNIINFKDFVVGPENVSWYNSFVTLSTYTVGLSSAVDTNISNLSTQIYTNLGGRIRTNSNWLSTDYNTKFNILSTTYQPRYYSYITSISIPVNSKSGVGNFNSAINGIVVSDINIVATNFSSASSSWWAELTSVQNPSNPQEPFTYTLTIRTNANVTNAAATWTAKVVKYY